MDKILIDMEVQRINQRLAGLIEFHQQISAKIERLEEQRRALLEQLEYQP